jgi:regulator of protease activity HflC (stomatin/prohibitin superfamily)
MGTFIFFCILVTLAAALLVVWRVTSVRYWLMGGAVAAVVAIGTLFLAVTTIVPPRTVGIPVTFGHVGSPNGSGLMWHAPWTDVVLMDATIQALDASGDNPTVAKDVDKADIFVHNNVRWSIKEEQASELYLQYQNFERVGDLLVQPTVRESIASVMQDFDPLASDNPQLSEIAATVKRDLEQRLADKINIDSVSITLLDPSEATKNRINALNIEKGNTRIAEQRALTAQQEANANRTLAESVSNDPNVLVSKCLDIVNEGRALPAGFQCWPGTGGSVVVPAGNG